MPSVPLAVSVSDILEVRGGPLRESEVWALLCQSAAAIQDFFIKAGASGNKDDTLFAISPASLTMSRDGQVTFSPGEDTWHGTDFMAPEFCSDTTHALSDTAIEKMFLFTLGKTLQVATEYGLRRNEYVSVSHHLDSLLEAMCEDNPTVRIGLRPILEACDLHTRQHPEKSPYAQTISRLYMSVLGSIDQTGHISSDGSCQSTLTLRSRRRPRHPHHFHHHHRHGSASSRSPSPTHSRSRSRSRSRNRDESNQQAEKPYEDQNENPEIVAGNTNSNSNGYTSAAAAAATSTPAPNSTAFIPTRTDPSQDLNASFTSSIDEHTSLYRSTPAYRMTTPVPGLLGLRMGSPAYEKYLKLKERQRRLKAAQTGEKTDRDGMGAGEYGGRLFAPHVMPSQSSGVWRGDIMDYVTDSRSMASLMSYTLGNYLPELAALDQHKAPSSTHEEEMERGSLLSSELSFLLHEQSQAYSQRPSHSTPEEQKQPTQDKPSRLKRQREEDTLEEHHEKEQRNQNQQQKKQEQQDKMLQDQDRPQPPQDLQLPKQESRNRELNMQRMHQFGSKELTCTPDSLPPRDFYGPEFVYRASRPVMRITMPLQGESLKNPALARRVIIVHLTGQKYEALVDPCMTGRQLFDAVVTHTGLDDFFFFGLTYICEGEHFFLDADTKLHKMAPEGWKEGAKGHMPPVTFTLYLRVKFYPDSLGDFRHFSSHHLLYLQLRRDILEERCTCDDDRLLALIGLALHAEFGDYNRRFMGQNYFVPEQYLPARVARRLGMGYVHDRALEAHRNVMGLAPSQCEIQFVKMVQGLPEYGIHYYKLMRVKNDSSSVVWVGLTQTSLLMAEQSGPHRSVIRALLWPAIMKISFNKRRFSVQPKIDPAAHAKAKPPKINFFTSSYRKGRYLLQLSTAQHRFHIRMRTRHASSSDTLGSEAFHESDDMQLASFMPLHQEPPIEEEGGREDAEEEEEEKEEQEIQQIQQLQSPSTHTMASVNSAPKSLSPETSSITSSEQEERPEAPPLKYRSPPPYRPNLDFFIKEFSLAGQLSGGLDWLNGAAAQDLHALGKADSMHGAANHEADSKASLQHINQISSDLSPHKPSHPQHPPPPYLPQVQSSLGRHVFEVTLLKEGNTGIGITIVGGETTSDLDLGIFVKSVVKDGPAARTGLIKAGDRLIAINGISLEGVQHHEAVQLIRESESQVSLLVSQMRAPLTIKRRKERQSVDDDDDPVCHSDDENGDADVERSLHTSLPQFSNIPHTNTTPSHSHPHYFPNHHTLSPQDFVDSRDTEQFRSDNSASGFLNINDFSAADGEDSVYEEMRDEMLLSEEMLTAAELETQSYGSSDIDRVLEAGTESDRETQELEILGDIANMAADDSDTDSDFETAVKATVEGKPTRSSSNLSEDRNTYLNRKGLGKTSSDQVTHGGVMEEENGLSGIITAAQPQKELKQHIKNRQLNISPNSFTSEEGGLHTPISPPSAFASTAPTPVSESLPVVPPPPPLHLETIRGEEDPSYNTQSDVDSDVLDSSRSELEKMYSAAERYLEEGDGDSGDYDLDAAFVAATAGEDSFLVEQVGDKHFRNLVGSKDYIKDGVVLAAPASDKGASNLCINRDARDGSARDSIRNKSPADEQSAESTDTLKPSESKFVDGTVESDRRKSLIRQHRVSERAVDTGSGDQCEEFRVDLKRSHGGGLGFTLVGGINTGGCFVKKVVQDPALSDGRLRPGDRLIKVNGQDMTGLSHFEAVTFLRHSQEDVSIIVRRSSHTHISTLNPPQQTSKHGPPQSNQDVISVDRLQESPKQIPAHHAEPDENSAESAVDLQQRLQDTTKEVQKSQTSVKDMIHSLEMPKVLSKPYDYSQKKGQTDSLKTGKERQHKQIQNAERTGSPDDNIESSSGTGVLRITLEKPKLSDSLGFSLVNLKKDGQSGIFVKTLMPGGISHTDGQLRVGDRLLQVNGLSLIGCSSLKAIHHLRELSGSVVLTVSRSSEGNLNSDDIIPQSSRTDMDLDGCGNFSLTPSDSTANSSEVTDDDINMMLNEAMTFLENEGNDNISWGRRAPTVQRDKQGTPTPQNSILPEPEAKNKKKQDSDSSWHVADSGHADFMNESEVVFAPSVSDRHPLQKLAESSSKHDENIEQCNGRNADKNAFPGYVRKLSSLKIPHKISEDWLTTLPVLLVEGGMEGRTTNLLQQLADAVELEEPMLEFQRLRQLKATDDCEVAKMTENKPRNRYRNVLPYDFNRVKLHSDDNDYINASDVKMNVKEDEDEKQLSYIACQGPLPATLAHFWQMVWECDTNVIVMVTQEKESGKVKCHQYWPDAFNQMLETDDGKYTVIFEEQQDVEDFYVRKLTLVNKNLGEKREITHLHYTTWPDHGVPDTAYPLLRFLRLMHQSHISGPFVVHCSAGIGRSGVLMAVDVALALIENGATEVDLFDIATELRCQRYGMIQTQDQYLFCYTACMEALLSIES